MKMVITQQVLKSLMHYEPVSGFYLLNPAIAELKLAQELERLMDLVTGKYV